MRPVAPLLVLAFLAVPLLEIYVIIQVGQVIGAGWTLLLLVADSALGAWLLRREGSRAWRALVAATRSGRMPDRELADAALVLVGGTLLLTPGFVTDLVGFWFLLPQGRPLTRRILTRMLARRLLAGPGSGRVRVVRVGVPPERPTGPSRVVPGEVVDPDPRRPGPEGHRPGD